MASMNPKSLVKLMQLLHLSVSDIARALYVSPSHVSRWKTGSRELKERNAYFPQLAELLLSVNRAQGERRLERFLLPSPDADPALLREKLLQFLVQPGQTEDAPPAAPPAVQIAVGLENRIAVLRQFFESVLQLSPKPDLYIKEVLYASWCPQHLGWFAAYHDYALRYMDAGGVIYYFSNLNNLDRATFYSIWRFTSHRNLYPGYSANMAEESPDCAYYLAEGARSVTFYVPEDHPKSYITTVCSDPLMLSAQEGYLKKKYEQRHHQIFINTIENRNLVLNIVLLHRQKLTPLLFAGRIPTFLLSPPESLQALLQENRVPAEAAKFCMKFHRAFREQLENPALRRTFFHYEEDLLAFAGADRVLDTELTGLAGVPVYLSRRTRRERLENLRTACAQMPHAVRLASRTDSAVYDALGDPITLWVKRNNWYLIFYPDPSGGTDLRLIIDALACTLRHDLYYQTLLNSSQVQARTLSFLDSALALLDRAGSGG